jgi:hypothetical protein
MPHFADIRIVTRYFDVPRTVKLLVSHLGYAAADYELSTCHRYCTHISIYRTRHASRLTQSSLLFFTSEFVS